MRNLDRSFRKRIYPLVQNNGKATLAVISTAGKFVFMIFKPLPFRNLKSYNYFIPNLFLFFLNTICDDYSEQYY